MNRQHTFVSALSLTLLWLLALPVHAATEAGRILFARGTVSIVGENESARGAGVGDVFHEGERIVTGNRSIVQLRLSDGALTALRSNSDYQIERQRFDEEADVYEQAGRLITGWMRSVTGTIGARYPGNVSQGTSVATIGIRGTTYQIIHVPEQGLPEFPNLQPGSYIYLEDGQIEVSNEAGSRIVSPGQVVRIRGPNVSPELTPELTELFQSQLLASLGGGDTDGFQVRDLLDGAGDQIVDGAAGGAAPPLGENVHALMSCSMCMSGSLIPLQNNIEQSDIGGSGQGRFVKTADVYMGSIYTALPGRSPVDAGYYAFYEDGELVSQVHWGRWKEADYSVNNEPGFGSWQYIFADNVNTTYEVGLTGAYRYTLAGSSVFRGTDYDSNAISTRLQGSSYVDIFFDDLSAGVNLSFSNGDTLTGFGSLGALYSEGLYLSGGEDNGALYGSMSGALLGSNGAGLMSLISYYNEQNLHFYSGSAVFERGGEVPLPALGGVSAFGVGESFPANSHKGVLDFGSVQVGITDGYFFPGAATMFAGGDTYALTGNTPAPFQSVQSHFVIDNNDELVTAVYWGLWDDYAISRLAEPEPIVESAASEWHFMVATNVLPESAIAAIGLTGEYTYDYVLGTGTPLRDVDGVGSDLFLQSGSNVVVDFGQLGTGSAIQVNLDISGSLLEGSGSLAQLYSSAGIAITDASLMTSGSLSGAFAGNRAEALLGAVNYFGLNSENYVGTALFERPPEVGVGN